MKCKAREYRTNDHDEWKCRQIERPKLEKNRIDFRIGFAALIVSVFVNATP